VAGNTATLDELTVPGFRLVGPLGFVLTKPEWLQRYEASGLVTSGLEWPEAVLGDTAGSVRIHDQRATLQALVLTAAA
jgi:hypothetical protein